MDNNVVGLLCKCSSDPDLNGKWLRADVEDECHDLGYPEEDWLSYLFSHLFSDYEEWNAELEDVFVNNASVMSICVKLGSHRVDVIKLY